MASMKAAVNSQEAIAKVFFKVPDVDDQAEIKKLL
jgi:hypothetical protein